MYRKKISKNDFSNTFFSSKYFLIYDFLMHFQVDLRTVSFDIPSQEILTKDSVTVRVDAVCYYKKVDATKTVCEVEDADMSTVCKFKK
mgnify:CR=1 FL=1